MTDRADAIVIGGGLAGAAAALRLARLGGRVALFEREPAAHHKVCGEFLSGAACAELAALDLDPVSLGAVRVGDVRLLAGRHALPAPLPFPACGLSRHRLDEALLARAADAGAVVHRGHAVRRVEGLPGRWSVGGVRAPALLLATGKHDLRGHGRHAAGAGDMIGFKMHLRLRPAAAADLAGAVEILPYCGGYAGLQLVEGEVANLCLVVSANRYAALGRCWDRLVDSLGARSPAFADRLAGAVPCFDRPLAVSRIPYGYVHGGSGEAPAPPGLYRLGDQFAVIPSFAGDGMAIALRSARRAAEAVAAGRPAASYHRDLRREVAGPVREAGLLAGVAATGPGRWLLAAAGRLSPPLVTWLAGRTRIRPAAAA